MQTTLQTNMGMIRSGGMLVSSGMGVFSRAGGSIAQAGFSLCQRAGVVASGRIYSPANSFQSSALHASSPARSIGGMGGGDGGGRVRGPKDVVVSAEIADGVRVEYTRDEFEDLLFRMRALTINNAWEDDDKGKERRISHPEVPGLEVVSNDRLFGDDERVEGSARWAVREGMPPAVFLGSGSAALMDLESVSDRLVVGYKNRDMGEGVYLTKGTYRGRPTILIAQPDYPYHSLESVGEWLKAQDFQTESVVVTQLGQEDVDDGVDEDEYGEVARAGKMKHMPGHPGVPLRYHASPHVMVGAQGFSLVGMSGLKVHAWESEVQKPVAGAGSSAIFAATVRDAVEGVVEEMVNQDGLFALTPSQLEQIYNALGSNRIFHRLEELWMEGFDGGLNETFIREGEYDKLRRMCFRHAISIFAAADVMDAVKPTVGEFDPRIERWRSYYFALSRISRGSYRYDITQGFLDKFTDVLKGEGLLEEPDVEFLWEGVLSCLRGSGTEGIGDHDVYRCVVHYFARYSPFPFRFLDGRLSLLNLVGGFSYSYNERLMSLLYQRGWHGLVIAAHLSGGQGDFSDVVGAYTAAAGLVKRYGFEPIGRVMALDARMDSEAVKRLLPAIERHIMGHADLDVGDEGSLIYGFVDRYLELGEECRYAIYCLKDLSRFINTKDDLDPQAKGSLGNLLVKINDVALERDLDREDLFTHAIPGLAHLAHGLEEIDPSVEGSLANIVIERSPFTRRSRWSYASLDWSDISEVLPFVESKGELMELFERLPFWYDNQQNIKSLMGLVNEKNAQRSGLSLANIGRLAIEVIKSRKPTYTVFLEGALSTAAIAKDRYKAFREFLVDEGVDVDLRMNILGDYAEVFQIEDMLLPSEMARRMLRMRRRKAAENEEFEKILEGFALDMESIIQDIANPDTGRFLSRSRVHAKIGTEINSLRRFLVRHVIGRELVEREAKLISSGQNFMKILRLVSLVFTIEGGKGFTEARQARAILRGALKALFSNFDPASPDAETVAITAMNDWLYSLGKDEIKALYSEGERINVEPSVRNLVGNREIVERLVAAGYDNGLWTEGVDIEVELSEGLSEDDKRRQILTATFELVEIALMLGVDDLEGEKVTLDMAKSLDTYAAAKEFVERMKGSAVRLPEEIGDRIRSILESVRDMEGQTVDPDATAATFRAIVKKDLFTEAYSGVGVPGCFNPRGIHREMPFVHGAEANSGFLQIFNAKGGQVANAVVLYSEVGAYVYPGYNSSAYNMDSVFGEELKELSRKVPAILMDSNSAGFDSLKRYATRVKKKIAVPPTLFNQRYFDHGKIEDDGTLTIEREFYVVTEESIRAGGGFEDRLIKAEASEEYPDISWQALADRFLRPDYERYPFLRRMENSRVFLQTIGAIKSAFMAGGWTIADDDLYEEIGAIVDERVGEQDDEVKDGVADIVIDFLEAQNWPMENSTLE